MTDLGMKRVSHAGEESSGKLARRQGWAVTEVYRENDTSAYRRRSVTLPDGSRAMRVVRPEYRRLLTDLANGRISGLVAYDLDRVARDPRDLEDLIDVVESRELRTASVTGSLNLADDSGVFMARMMVNVANKASRDTARRVRRKLAENAIDGKHHGGLRPYGWEEDRVTAQPDEAAAIRQAADMLIGGHSIKAIVRALNGAGATNTLGAPLARRHGPDHALAATERGVAPAPRRSHRTWTVGHHPRP